MKFDVVGIDNPCVDLAVNLAKFPQPNGGEMILDISLQGGGKVATGIVATARMGGVKCAILGNVGTDRYGQFCVDDFVRHGIDVEGLLQREGTTTNYDLVVSNRETMGRSIMCYPGTSKKLDVEELNEEYLKQTKYLYIACINDLNKKAMEIVKAAGGKVFIDADGYSKATEESLSDIDVFVGSEFFYHGMFGKEGDEGYDDFEGNCRKVMEQGPEIVVFTFGEKGCVGLSKEGFFQLPAYNVDVVDTVGAGDVYHGAFVACLVKGWSVKETAQFCSAVSAIKCTRIGGRAGIPNEETTRKFMETGVIDYSEIDERVAFYRKEI